MERRAITNKDCKNLRGGGVGGGGADEEGGNSELHLDYLGPTKKKSEHEDLLSAASKQGEEHVRVFAAAWRQKARVTYARARKNPEKSASVEQLARTKDGLSQRCGVAVLRWMREVPISCECVP